MRCAPPRRPRWRLSRASSGRCTTCCSTNQLHLKPNQLHSYAEQLNLDMARYTAEMDDEIYRQRIREHIDSGRRSGVRGTPGIFVNGVIHDVSAGMQSLFDKVEAILRK